MRILLTIMFALALSACSSSLPAPSVSEYIQTEGGGFLLEHNAGIKYAMTYTLLRPSHSATSYKATFESTIPNGNPVVTEAKIEPGALQFEVQSPVIAGVKNNHTYSVSLTLYVDDTRLATHEDRVRFSVPSSILAQYGIPEH